MTPIERRLEILLRSWPKPLARDLRRYLSAGARRPAARACTAIRQQSEYYWLLLPCWLLAKYSRDSRSGIQNSRTPGSKVFLRDILWGQYCLFLFVRIHDDLFDGQAQYPSLLFAADELFIESQRAFLRHFPGGPFWGYFHRFLDTSIRGIVEVDAIQRRRDGSHGRAINTCARVSCVFRTGAAAVCVQYGRATDLRLIARFADGLAVASQILDDLLDVEEDFHSGRLNLAASSFLGRIQASQTRRPSTMKRIARSLLIGDGLDRVFTSTVRSLESARRAIQPLGLPAATAYVDSFRRGVTELERCLHRERVRRLLGVSRSSAGSERSSPP